MEVLSLLHQKSFIDNMKMIRDHGAERKYCHPLLGVNARLNAVQCAILSVKLKFFEWELKKREEVARRYHEGLSHLPLILPVLRPGQDSSWAQYTVRVGGKGESSSLFTLCGYSYRGSLSPYPARTKSLWKFFSGERLRKLFPEAYKASREVLSLPLHPYLKEEEQDRVMDEFCRYFASL